jgi:methyl-accepting chemotaxis protein
MPIRIKVLFACLLMTAVTAAIGLYAQHSEAQLGTLAIRMYDESFMSISFVRSAETRVAGLRALYLQLDRDGAPGKGPDVKALRQAFGDVGDDLDVAIERTADQKTRAAAQGVRKRIDATAADAADPAKALAGLGQIAKELEQVVERFAQDGYREREKAEAIVTEAHRSLSIAIGGSMLAALLITVLMSQTIAPPVRRAARIASAIAAGKLDNEVPRARRAGWSETATLLQALAGMQESLRDQIAQIEAMRVADRAQAADAAMERKRALLTMADDVEREMTGAVQGFVDQSETMAGTAIDMEALSEQTGGNAQTAAAAAQTALDEVRATTAAAGELTESIIQINAQITRSTAAVQRATETSRDARQSIDALALSVGRIGSVAGLISDIAARTSLLALNATIEAARAGDAGKGFAIVAGEVKSLAMQTANSTKQIADHIEEVREGTGQAFDSVVRIERAIAELDAVARATETAVVQQSSAASDIARTVTETSNAANELAGLIAEVASFAGSTRSKAGAVREQARALSDSATRLHTNVVKVIRNSDGVERRGHPRTPVEGRARLTVDGMAPMTVALLDLSSSGVGMTDVPQALAGQRGLLEIDGIDCALPLRMTGRNDPSPCPVMGAQFECDERQRQALDAFIARSSAQAA